MNARRLVALVRDRIEMARMRRVIRRAARNPFDDAQQRASDTANCALDYVDTRPGDDDRALAELNRIYNAPSWEEE